MPNDEVRDEVEELVDGRLRELVAEHINGFSEDNLIALIEKAFTRKGMAVQVNPTFNVPKGEPPVAQFSMPPMQPRFDVPQVAPPAVTIAPPSAKLLMDLTAVLEKIHASIAHRGGSKITFERNNFGLISSCTIERT